MDPPWVPPGGWAVPEAVVVGAMATPQRSLDGYRWGPLERPFEGPPPDVDDC
jgi:hypothetical protein